MKRVGCFCRVQVSGETWRDENGCGELLEEVLELCGGVPLMLSIAGAQVRGHGGSPRASLKHLLHCLNVKRVLLPEEHGGRYPSCFNHAVAASLGTIADVLRKSAKFNKQWDEYCRSELRRGEMTVVEFVMDCFLRLCVLPRNARVSEDVIFCIWGNIDEAMAWSLIDCLVEFHLFLELKDGEGNSNFGLHDVILDYCEKASQYGQGAKYTQYHTEVLSCAWKRCWRKQSSMCSSSTPDTSEDCDIGAEAFWVVEACEKSRAWWRILSSCEDLSGIEKYVVENVFRHLKESGRIAEAVGLLSHMGWTKVRVSHGGIIALNADFSLVTSAVELHCGKEDEGKAYEDALQGIREIWDMVKKAWPVIITNSEALPTHAYGYLLDKKNELGLVERYLQSGEDIVSGAWFKPKSAFWHMLESSSDQRVFRTGEIVVDVALVEGKQVILAATRRTLFWIETETMSAIQCFLAIVLL